MTSAPSSLRRYKSNDGIFFPRETDSSQFRYTDGTEFEQNLFHIIASTQDKSLCSNELRQAILNWPLRCHLSPARANILRPFEERLRDRAIAELGAGCGAITRYLGELGAEVDALEASPVRARILRERTSDLQNVKIVCDRIENFRPHKTYDLVTLIGVLQYARLFSDIQDAAEEKLLACSANLMSPEGALLLAIQNPLGLRYWSGWPEPNADLPFFGIEDRYDDQTVIRFGLQQLKRRLTAVGLPHIAVLFPFPDYHIASSILTEAAMMGSVHFNAPDIIALSESESRRHPDFRLPLFSMEQAWRQVLDEGLGQQLANSFVVVAAQSPNALHSIAPSEINLAWHYSVDRPNCFATSTIFHKNGDSIEVEKHLTYPNARARGSILEHQPISESYVPGALWWSELVRIVNRPDWTVGDVTDWARPWLQHLLLVGYGAVDASLDEVELNGKWFDATPANLVRSHTGQYRFFDLEWKLKEPIPLIFLTLKALFGSISLITSCSRPTSNVPHTICGLSLGVAKELGFSIDETKLEGYFQWHFRTMKEINQNMMLPDFAIWQQGMRSWEIPQRRQLNELIAKSDAMDKITVRLFHQNEPDSFRMSNSAQLQEAVSKASQLHELTSEVEKLRVELQELHHVRGAVNNLLRSVSLRLRLLMK